MPPNFILYHNSKVMNISRNIKQHKKWSFGKGPCEVSCMLKNTKYILNSIDNVCGKTYRCINSIKARGQECKDDPSGND